MHLKSAVQDWLCRNECLNDYILDFVKYDFLIDIVCPQDLFKAPQAPLGADDVIIGALIVHESCFVVLVDRIIGEVAVFALFLVHIILIVWVDVLISCESC